MSATLTLNGTYVLLECCVCHIQFGVPQNYYSERRGDHKSWHCPEGHRQYFSGQSDAERLAGELKAANERLEASRILARREARRRHTTERQLAAQKGVATKLRKRAANGVCPACQRTFANVARHVHGQHPEYVAALKEDD